MAPSCMLRCERRNLADYCRMAWGALAAVGVGSRSCCGRGRSGSRSGVVDVVVAR